MKIIELLKIAINMNASDLHITVGVPPIARVNGKLEKIGEDILLPNHTLEYVKEMLDARLMNKLLEIGEIDFSYSQTGVGRFRANIFRQRGSYGIALRVIPMFIPNIDQMNLPPILKDLSMKRNGLVLVTGPTGSGKSTTLAAMVEHMNRNRSSHIITIEDPIEFLHSHNKSIINQREIGNDSTSFSKALRSSLRQDPDVILVGEMRDLDTISTAVTAAETGHLVLSTLHTIGAANTADRIIDVFPSNQQSQIRAQLAGVLQGIISQQIIPRADGKGRVATFEIMTATPAAKNLIREGKTHQLQTIIETGAKHGMQTMDSSLIKLYNSGIIDKENLRKYAVDLDAISRQVGY
ncbi:twitching motility protein PilT [Acetoanaerobium pronyense]|uniref:Twitching motility protein PilT n=1 Tax=Acetoanaerobium pronyense TaxID=1482736 RepID=A0ABS4KJQ8_9FIRM|nr:type IV pilus twitching motility protein PilT [Acetoanaerobium pronyense]MBP2027361.1 twitching motility protein PilT [Acetoanaerobium pronyense]